MSLTRHYFFFFFFYRKRQRNILKEKRSTNLKVILGGLKELIVPLFLERVQSGWIGHFLKRRFEWQFSN